MGSVAYYSLALALVFLGASAYMLITWKSGYNDMSNTVVVLRTAAIVLAIDGAIWLYGIASEEPGSSPGGRQIFAVAIAVYSLVMFAWQASYVRTKRRHLVEAWKDGRDLPRGVSEESIRVWANNHPR